MQGTQSVGRHIGKSASWPWNTFCQMADGFGVDGKTFGSRLLRSSRAAETWRGRSPSQGNLHLYPSDHSGQPKNLLDVLRQRLPGLTKSI